MGINNKGVKYAVSQLQKHRPNVIIGGNIAKASVTPNEEAYKDYERAFSLLYDYVDYFTVNVSCPNVKDLTVLQDVGYLADIVDRLLTLRRYYDDYRPILLKISPDIPYDHVDRIVELALTSGLDGIIATNTTNSREGLVSDPEKVQAIGNGGLSGQPLYGRNTADHRCRRYYESGTGQGDAGRRSLSDTDIYRFCLQRTWGRPEDSEIS